MMATETITPAMERVKLKQVLVVLISSYDKLIAAGETDAKQECLELICRTGYGIVASEMLEHGDPKDYGLAGRLHAHRDKGRTLLAIMAQDMRDFGYADWGNSV